MKFLSAQPDIDYYIWQLEVQCHNFRKYDFEKDMIILLGFTKDKGINPNAQKFASKTKAKVVFVEDSRNDKTYIPSIRPHIIKKYYATKGIDDSVFYHDSDIIFIRKPNFEILNKENTLYVSDTISYIGAKYIQSKGDNMLDKMCDVVGINKELVIENELNSGGAQYLFNKTLDYKFWNKVEKDSTELYVVMQKNTAEHPIQSWCADMWAVLWNSWKIGIKSEVVDALKFCWATELISKVKKISIYHNAGATRDRTDLFFKGDYIDKSPYGVNFDYVKKKYCSRLYVDEINQTGIYMKSLK